MLGDEIAPNHIIHFDDHADSLRTTDSSKHGRFKSKVWKEFTPILSAGKVQSAQCKHCGKQLSGKTSGGTSHLSRHLKICTGRSVTNARCQQGSSLQHTLSKNWNFDREESIEELTRAIIANSCAFSITSNEKFRKFLAGINPTFSLVPQATVEERFLSIFSKEKLKLKEEISLTHGGVFLSLGNWEHGLEQNFLCLRLQYIDDNWKINRKIIRCVCSNIGEYFLDYYLCLLPDWDSLKNIDTELFHYHAKAAKCVVKEAIDDWSLKHKILGLAYMCASDKTRVTMDLEENLSGQNYLVAKGVTCFRYMTFSPVRKKKYEEILSKLCLSRPSFGSKRWYLTFYLLKAALQFLKAFPNIEKEDPPSYIGPPSPQQLEAAENFCKIVEPIYDAIKVVSDPHCMTFNSYFHALWSLRTTLQESSTVANIDHVLDLKNMQTQFDKNWREWYLWLSIAVVLDPRYKIRFLELRFTQGFGHDASIYISEVRGKVYELFIQYSFHVNEQSVDMLNEIIRDLHLDAYGCESLYDMSQSYNAQEGHDEFKELNEYLGAELCTQNEDFDILKWWKDNASMYPTLARLARDVLAIPGCAVSSDSAFLELDERASILYRKVSLEVIEALICTQDWIRSSQE
ncbi:hypothetical protein E2562_000527 [Oryza meyeriana var. granulata]|uniref:BED-type domain-containing protein n=1 Tax=Oryza meyeriana var. granulata TaxID=110450 RepID=A0A6G1CDY0_9ORYZ|nr:hypothetical protein E2562_000527 [Oryza meyeriana var. granulata]KAF0897828.1 hypothetical protein E2562_000527 [Oryza meyeriana var. granulata]KAF0897830.1 hypothetical protein E2562_000527 [Oryza meyeriana var. granulata]KAF0897833.1 hypothetical protein E2562_000527 [Oryza meyeriana var. granulata]